MYRNEHVYRLTCKHVFHESCWDDYTRATRDDPECPNCRGPGIVKSLYKYMGASREEAEESRRRLEALRRTQRPEEPASNNSAFEDASSTDEHHEPSFMASASEIKEW
eukprot:7699148-Lingulodinium_polyedra.AAC.1